MRQQHDILAIQFQKHEIEIRIQKKNLRAVEVSGSEESFGLKNEWRVSKRTLPPVWCIYC
jgi:hypothetical protein